MFVPGAYDVAGIGQSRAIADYCLATRGESWRDGLHLVDTVRQGWGRERKRQI